MKPHHVLLILMLVFGGLSVLPSQGQSSPVIGEVSFNYANNSTVGPGDNVVLRVNVTYSGEVFVSAQIVIEYPSGNNTLMQYLLYLSLEYNSSTGLYENNFVIDAYWPEGVLYIEYLDVSTSTSWYTFYRMTDYASPSLIVAGTDPDFTGPELISLTSSPANGSILGPGDTISFTLNAFDNQSGFSNAYVDIYYTNGNNSGWIQTLYFGSYTGENNFTGTSNFTIGQFSYEGTYYLDNLALYDMMGNSRYYYKNDLNLTFFVNGTTLDNTPPVVHGVDILSSTAIQGSEIEVWVNVSDDLSGIQYGYVEISAWSSSNGSTVYAGGGSFYENGNTSVTLTFPVYVNDYQNFSGYDYIFVNYIYIEDVALNYFLGYNGTDFISPMVPLQINRPPALVNVTVDSPVHRAGETVTFSMEILPDQPSGLQTLGTPWVDVSIKEVRPDGTSYLTYTGAFSNGTSNIYFVDYFIDYSAPTNTSVYIDSLIINDGPYRVYYENGVNMTSPMVVVSNEGPSNEYIEIFISPDYVSTQVGTPVDFTVQISSYFNHDMPNVTLVVEATKDGQSIEVFVDSYYLPAQSSFTANFSVVFNEAGSYRVVGTLYDDIGAPWSASVLVDVSESGTGTNPTEPTNSTSSADNSTSSQPSETNSTLASPTFELTGLAGLPAFEFYVGIFAFATLVYGIRRKRKF